MDYSCMYKTKTFVLAAPHLKTWIKIVNIFNDIEIYIAITTITKNSLQHQAAWGQHNYALSSIPIYLTPLFLHPLKKLPLPLHLSLQHPPTTFRDDLLFVWP